MYCKPEVSSDSNSSLHGELYYQVQHFREIKKFMQGSGRMELQDNQSYGGDMHELQTS